jgi:hypothetical protein
LQDNANCKRGAFEMDLPLVKKTSAVICNRSLGFAWRHRTAPGLWPREHRLFFLLKCAFWLGLVFLAMTLSSEKNPSVAPGERQPSPRADPKINVLSNLSRSAAERAAAAARRRCFERPRDCLEILETLRSGASVREPTSH